MMGMKMTKSDTTLGQLDGDDVLSEEVDSTGKMISERTICGFKRQGDRWTKNKVTAVQERVEGSRTFRSGHFGPGRFGQQYVNGTWCHFGVAGTADYKHFE